VLDFFEFSTPELQPAYVRLAHLRAERDLLYAAIPRVVLTEVHAPAHHAGSAARQLDG
jgi:hypothetical protein